MDTKKFLQLVVPSEGRICIADHVTFSDGKKAFVHYPFQDHSKAAWFAQRMDERGSIIYFATATYLETFENKNNKTRVKRTQKNVAFLKSIWLDIDYKDCPAKELVPKLGTFIHKTGIPKPTLLVKSGGGLHIYWCLKESVIPERWAPLAEGLKQLCKDHDLPADHVCTSDAARVLRPVGTTNRKYDPAVPVTMVAGSEECYEYEALLSVLPKIDKQALPAHLRGRNASNVSEYSDTGTSRREVDTARVIKRCAVLRETLRTGGTNCSEPEWNATLLLLRFLPDGAKLVHPMSRGHIDYTPADTVQKWQEKLEANVSGPPLCSTLEQYGHTKLCQPCPIYKSKKQKTPLALGYIEEQPQTPTPQQKATPAGKFVQTPTHGYPYGWRPIPGNEGVERKYFDKDAGEWCWEPILKRTWRIKEAQKSLLTGISSIRVEAAQVTGRRIEIDVPGGYLGGCPELYKLLGEHGAPLLSDERQWWCKLMTTWLAKIQQENAELETVERYGWVRDQDPDNPKLIGFASGTKMFMTNKMDKESVRVAADHAEIGKLYKPLGKLEEWQRAAKYLTDQNNPAFTALLASSFAAPLLTFTELPGAVLTVVSKESGIGKTSAMRVAQSVWGMPRKGMNSTNDTALSVTKKVAFLNNLPAYWDEIRGQKALDSFYQVAFDVAQGHEKTRLNQAAQLREVADWQTLMIAASNDSLFDYMAEKGGVSDASIARTFEIEVDATQITPDLNAGPLFGVLDLNYGHAGQMYSKHLARNHKKVQARMEKMLLKTREWAKGGGERFWCAIIAALIVGAAEAKSCGVVDIDIGKLAGFLRDNLLKLRSRTGGAMTSVSPRELVGDYIQHYQSGEMVIDSHPTRGQKNYLPNVIRPMKGNSLMMVRAGNTYRFRKGDFTRWLQVARRIQYSSIKDAMVRDLGMVEMHSQLGIGTPHALPRNWLIEVALDSVIDLELGDE